MNIEKISNGNEKISKTELYYLEKLADGIFDFSKIHKQDLVELKKTSLYKWKNLLVEAIHLIKVKTILKDLLTKLLIKSIKS